MISLLNSLDNSVNLLWVVNLLPLKIITRRVAKLTPPPVDLQFFTCRRFLWLRVIDLPSDKSISDHWVYQNKKLRQLQYFKCYPFLSICGSRKIFFSLPVINLIRDSRKQFTTPTIFVRFSSDLVKNIVLQKSKF